MESKDIINKGNGLEAKLLINIINNNRSEVRLTSPEFIINGVAVFQVRVISAVYSRMYNNFIFAQFTKQIAKDDLTYTITFTSKELEVVDKRLTSDDGTWHLLYENKKQQFTIDVSVRMDVLPCMNYFASLHEDTELTDFELRGTDGAVRVHRAVLAAASPVLRRMLSGEWRETAEGYVDVPGTTSATLQHLKDYLYLHTLPESGLEQLLLISSCYMMPDLEQKCVDKLVHDVSAANAYDIIEFAVTHKMKRLVFAILDRVQSSVVSVTDMRLHYHSKPARGSSDDSEDEILDQLNYFIDLY